MSGHIDAEDDTPDEARRAYVIARETCGMQLGKLASLISSAEERLTPFRLSVPRPEPADSMNRTTEREPHSLAVGGLLSLAEDIKELQVRVIRLLDELEV